MRESLIEFLTPRSKKEAIKLVALYTVVAIAATIAVDYLFVLALGEGLRMIFTSAVVIPLALAPPMTWFVVEAARRNNEMKQELERLICIDPLSGALNRRGLAAFEARAFRESGEKAALSGVILDVDRFKLINDTYGHAAGDAVIEQVARIVAETSRHADCVVGRLGGDELVAYFVEQSLEETMIHAERLRDVIEHTIFVHEDRRIMITVSIGVAASDPDDTDAEPMLKRADQSLYAAKTAGRNRVRAVA